MLEIIAIIVFVISLGGVVFIIRRKIPVLVELQEVAPVSFKVEKERFRLIFMQKMLSKIRLLVLKTDNKTNEWMKRLREKSKENKTKFSEDYWNKLRK